MLEQVAGILNCYGSNVVTGDQHYSDAISQQLLKLGIIFKVFVFGSTTRCNIFSSLKHLLVQHRVELLDDRDLLSELRSLREEKTPRGVIDVRPTSGKDDSAVALAVAANEAVSYQAPTPFDMGSSDPCPSPSSLGLDPENCALEAPCWNSRTCRDEGNCLGFVPEILVPISREPMARLSAGS